MRLKLDDCEADREDRHVGSEMCYLGTRGTLSEFRMQGCDGSDRFHVDRNAVRWRDHTKRLAKANVILEGSCVTQHMLGLALTVDGLKGCRMVSLVAG
jgi:hypothetical protein